MLLNEKRQCFNILFIVVFCLSIKLLLFPNQKFDFSDSLLRFNDYFGSLFTLNNCKHEFLETLIQLVLLSCACRFWKLLTNLI